MTDRPTRTVLVTGGTGGIGRSLVHTFAALGDEVWFTDPVGVPQPPEGTGEAAVLSRGFQLDLTTTAASWRAGRRLPGGPDGLIHNAALGSA
jgi:NAD(P)-dependent dehydrogenase (short-subunit alcohol dehydrogenase family)